MTDFKDLKDSLDLVEELEKDLGPGRKSGRWVMFSCPFPGHSHGDRNPSLGATPATQTFYCFTCGKTGDLITWLKEYRGMSWENIKDLADSDSLPPPRPRAAAELLPDPSGPPSPIWQAQAESWLESCQKALWTPGGEKALEYLHTARGLNDDSIKYYGLGYNPQESYSDPAAWGFDPESWKAEHKNSKLWLPRGIVIPWRIGGELWGVNIRRPLSEEVKYRKISGSRAALFGAGNLTGSPYVLMTEGEFDCILADQTIGDAVGCASLGSASKKLDVAAWGAYLLPARAILAAYDIDEAGKHGLVELVSKSARIHPVRVPALRPGDKDITDFVKAGGDLWEWFKYNLDRLGLLPELESYGPDFKRR